MANVSGSVILIWPGTVATIPTGWTRVTELDGLYPLAASSGSNPGSTGGSNLHAHPTGAHTHSGSAHTHTVPNSGSASTQTARDSGTVRPPNTHTHVNNPNTTNSSATTGSDSPSSGSVNLEPDYYSVIYIRSNGTNGISASMVAIWSGSSSLPSGWNLADGVGGRPDLRNKFLKGAETGANSGSTSGSAGHTHALDTHTHGGDYVHTHPDVTSSGSNQAMTGGPITGGTASTATQAHTHTLTINSQGTDTITGSYCIFQTGSNSEPPYVKQAFIYGDGTTTPFGIIGLWTGLIANIPSDWDLCDGTNGTPDLRDKFIKGGSALGEIGITGGSLTHTHTASGHNHPIATHAHTITSASGANSTETAGATNVAAGNHTHAFTNSGSSGSFLSTSATPTVSAVSSLPAYYTVAYIQFLGSASAVISACATMGGVLSTSIAGNNIVDSNISVNGIGGIDATGSQITFATTDIILASSSYIAAGGGSSTTAQLNPPSGKSSGSFQAGYISDDTNPLASLDIVSDKYTELEWSIKFTPTASGSYQFRVIASGSPLDTYSVTPVLYVGTGGSGAGSAIVSGSSYLSGNTGINLVALNNVLSAINLQNAGDLSLLSSLIDLALASLNGTGVLNVSALVAQLAQLSLSGQGDIQSLSTLLLLGIVGLVGTGSFSLNALINILGIISLSGSGILDATGSIFSSLNASMTGGGSGDIQPLATLLLSGISTLSGNGDLSAIALSTIFALVSLGANGILDISSLLTILSQISMSGRGDIQALSNLLVSIITNLLGSGDLIVTPSLTVLSNVVLDGIASILASAVQQANVVDGQITLSGNLLASLNALNTILTSSVSLSGVGIVDVQAFLLMLVQLVLAGQANLLPTALQIANGTFVADGKGILDAQNLLVVLAQNIVSGNGNLQPLATLFISVITTLSGNGDLTLSTIYNIVANTILNASGDISAYSLVILQALVSLLGRGDISSNALLTVYSNTILDGLASLTGAYSTQGLVTAIANLSGQGDLVVSALNLIAAQLSLSGRGDLNPNAVDVITGQLSLSGVGVLLLDSLIVVVAQMILSGQIANQFDAKVLIDAILGIGGLGDSLSTGLNSEQALSTLTGTITDLASALLIISSLINIGGIGILDALPVLVIPSYTELNGILSLLAIAGSQGFVDAQAILFGQGNLTLNALEIINAQLALYSNGDINPNPVLRISAFTSLDGIAFLIATGTINVIAPIIDGQSILVGRGDLILSALNVVNGEALTTGQAILSMQSLVNVLSNAIISGTGNTQAYATLLIGAIGALYAAGIIFPVGVIPTGILQVTPLSRTFVIRGEDRIYVVDSEGRIFIINSEDRTFSISEQ